MERKTAADLRLCQDESEVVVEIGNLAIVLKLLPYEVLIGIRGNLPLQQPTDLANSLLLWLPHRRSGRRHRPAASPEESIEETWKIKRDFRILVWPVRDSYGS